MGVKGLSQEQLLTLWKLLWENVSKLTADKEIHVYLNKIKEVQTEWKSRYSEKPFIDIYTMNETELMDRRSRLWWSIPYWRLEKDINNNNASIKAIDNEWKTRFPKKLMTDEMMKRNFI